MRILVLAALVGLSACAGTIEINSRAQQRVQGQSVPVGEAAEASVGGIMLAQYDYQTRLQAIATAAYRRRLGLNVVELPEGQIFNRALFERSKEAWCSNSATWFSLGTSRALCMFDPANPAAQLGSFGVLTSGWMPGTAAIVVFDVEVPYRIVGTPMQGGYRIELVYRGVENGSIRLTYREYADHPGEPAVQQDLSYPLEPGGGVPTSVTVRNARFEVLSAGINSIRYRVLAGFR